MSLSGPQGLIFYNQTTQLKGAISIETSLDMINITLRLLLDMIHAQSVTACRQDSGR